MLYLRYNIGGYVMLEIYNNIKRYRKRLGMTQSELAERMGYADKSMISRVEQGKIDLTQSRVVAFANVLHVTPSELLGDDGINYDNREWIDGSDLLEKLKKLSKDDLALIESMVDNLLSRASK